MNNLYFCSHHTNFLSPYDIECVIAAFFFSGCAQRRKGKLFFLLCLGITLAHLDVISGHCCADDFENAKYYKMFSDVFLITAK